MRTGRCKGAARARPPAKLSPKLPFFFFFFAGGLTALAGPMTYLAQHIMQRGHLSAVTTHITRTSQCAKGEGA